MNTPKILLYDLEVSRDVVEGYGNKWEFKVVKTIRHQELMCFAYKWLDEDEVYFISRWDFRTKKEFTKALWDILNRAEIAIAHNATRFDNKMANRYFLKAGLGPVSPYKTIDTLQVARSTFKFQSNGLNDLGEYLELGTKEKISYAELEDDFLKKNDEAIRLMERYNVQDVILLEKIYLAMRPFIKNHPNLGDIARLKGVCPKCKSNALVKKGTRMRASGKSVQEYRCTNCGGWCNEGSLKVVGRIVNA